MINIKLAKEIFDLGLTIDSENYHTNDIVFPMPNAEELLSVIPGKIVVDTKAYYLRICKEELNYHVSYFRLQYIDDKTITYLMRVSIIDENITDALAKLVIWLIN